jgi:serine/threonine-protein kinase RsbT
MISTAVSELARNIIIYASKGNIVLNAVEDDSKRGIEVVAEDSGPGIQNLENAMKDKFSTGDTLGVGLPGTKRLMDDFQICSSSTEGTKVTIRKWI